MHYATTNPELTNAWYVWAGIGIAAAILWTLVVIGIVRWVRQNTERPNPTPPKSSTDDTVGSRLRVESCWQCGGTSIHHKSGCRRNLDREGL